MAERGFTSYKAVNWVRRCNSCGHGLEKISGCDHVTSVDSLSSAQRVYCHNDILYSHSISRI